MPAVVFAAWSFTLRVIGTLLDVVISRVPKVESW